MRERSNFGSKIKLKLRNRINREVALSGLLRIFKVTPEGRELLATVKNTLTTDFLEDTAAGAATGLFDAFGNFRINTSTGGPYLVIINGWQGGSGAENYVILNFEWLNNSGVDRTINSIDGGFDLGAGGEVIYSQVTGLTIPVANNMTVAFEWTITCSSVTEVEDDYLFLLAEMLVVGTFEVPTAIYFYFTDLSGNSVVATLEEGGTGDEAYHQWTATYTHSGANKTLDIIRLIASLNYTSHDIANKELADTEELEAHIRVTHSAA